MKGLSHSFPVNAIIDYEESDNAVLSFSPKNTLFFCQDCHAIRAK